LDDALQAIAIRYGARTADFVAMQLEHPARASRSAVRPSPTRLAGGSSATG
jgi:hypothetical protein